VVENVAGLINFRNITTNAQWTFEQSDIGLLRHSENNWCVPNMAINLEAAIHDYFEWSFSEEGGRVHIILSLNDMSLPLGGRFDINALWDRNTQGERIENEHYYHRKGTSIDINRSVQNGQGVTLDLKNHTAPDGRTFLQHLTRIFENHGGTKYPERPIHYDF
jgi:hypothetical protein